MIANAKRGEQGLAEIGQLWGFEINRCGSFLSIPHEKNGFNQFFNVYFFIYYSWTIFFSFLRSNISIDYRLYEHLPHRLDKPAPFTNKSTSTDVFLHSPFPSTLSSPLTCIPINVCHHSLSKSFLNQLVDFFKIFLEFGRLSSHVQLVGLICFVIGCLLF